MKPVSSLLLPLAACAMLLEFAPSGRSQTMLVDFGMDSATVSGTAGTSTVTAGPDSNGNYWTNFDVNAAAQTGVGAGYVKGLLTTGSGASGVTMTVTTSDVMAINGGDTVNLGYVPLASISNQNLAIKTAVDDLWYINAGTTKTGVFTLSGLNQWETYDFSILSLRPFAGGDGRAAIFTVAGATSLSGTSLCATGTSWGSPTTSVSGNLNTVDLKGIAATGSNTITVTMGWNGIGSAALNAMQITGYVPYTTGTSLGFAKSYSGNTILNAGASVSANVSGALGSGTSAVGTSVLEIGSGGGSLTLGANQAIDALIGSGNLALDTGASTLSITGSSSNVFSLMAAANGSNSANVYSGVLSGNGTIKKTGASNFTLSGSNTFAGTFAVSAGTLTLGNSNALQNAVLDTGTGGGAVVFSAGVNNLGGIQGSAALNIANTTLSVGSGAYTGVVSGAGALAKSGTGTLTLSAGNTFSGGVTINGGTLGIYEGSSLGALPASPSNQLTFAANGTLRFEQTPSVVVGANRQITINSGVSATIDTQGFNASIGGIISGSGALIKAGSGLLTLAGGNTFSGGITLSSGTLSIYEGTSLGSLPATASTQLTFAGDTTLRFEHSPTPTNANRQFAINPGNTATIDTQNYNVTLGGAITGDSGNLRKVGSGTLTVNANNTFGGSTSVDAGTLIVAGSLSATSSVGIASGAQLVANGAISPTATVNLNGILSGSGSLGDIFASSGATVSPGSKSTGGSTGILSASSLFLDSGAHLSIHIGGTIAGSGYDQLKISGGIALLGDLQGNLLNGYTPVCASYDAQGNLLSPGDKFALTLGATSTAGAFSNQSDGTAFSGFNPTITLDGVQFAVFYNGVGSNLATTGGNDIILMAVPEPGSWAMVISGFGILLGFQKMRKTRVGTR